MSGSWQTLLEPSTLSVVLCAAGTIAMGCRLSTSAPVLLSGDSAKHTSNKTLVLAVGLPVVSSLLLLLFFYFMNIIRYVYDLVLGVAVFTSVVYLLEPPAKRAARLLPRVLTLPRRSRFVAFAFAGRARALLLVRCCFCSLRALTG